jgi:hypothetical protein
MAKFNLTPEQSKAAKKAKSPEELIAMAKEQGVAITAEQAKAFLIPPIGEISDEELANVAGGGCGNSPDDFSKCPKCGSRDIVSNDTSYLLPNSLKDFPANTFCNTCRNWWTR